MIYGTVVKDDVMIARNAGQSLKQIETIGISAFKTTTEDLAELHKRVSYLIDINLEHMGYDAKNDRIN